jgi:hypothetical protein
MEEIRPLKFKAEIEIIGINPFVFVPDDILQKIFEQAGKNKGTIPIKGFINGHLYRQTLLKYRNHWRVYINTLMLKNSPKRIGEIIELTIEFDSESREIQVPVIFLKALETNKEASLVFQKLTPSIQKEIVRYLTNLKTEQGLQKNVEKAINFLIGKGV